MYPIVTENEKIKITEKYFTMPDGVNLYTRIVSPKRKDKFPIIFIRTPYEPAHNGIAHDISQYENDKFIKNGYAIVLQHCRGRGDSEGVCVPYNERDDGLSTLEAIRKLEIYNGNIYLLGGSYLSTAHLCYLDTNPKDVKGAILKIQTDRMYFRNYRNGCCYDFCNLNWWLGMLDRQFPNPKLDEAIKRPYKNIMQRVIGTDFPNYTDLLINDKYNDFWEIDPRTHAIDKLKIPVLFVEGWYDFYIEGMFSMWERLPKSTKNKSAFIVGPWGHGTSVGKNTEYPLSNGNIPDDYEVEWFNSIQNSKDYKYAQKNHVNYYCIGEDDWKISKFPNNNGKVKRFYFGGQNNLQSSPVKTEKCISYKYDPENRLNCFKYHSIYKAASIGEIEGVISFQSEEFCEETSFFGKIRWNMSVSTDCEDTAYFIRVYFVENNIAYNLTETITSISHIKENYKPGERINIDLLTPPIAFTVKKGSSIRVDISSDGGIYVPHANVKGHWAEVTETKIATNTIYLNDSFIELNME